LNLSFRLTEKTREGKQAVFEINKTNCKSNPVTRSAVKGQSSEFKFCDNATVTVRLIDWQTEDDVNKQQFADKTANNNLNLPFRKQQARFEFIICRPNLPASAR
jgi:hypothetical protein